MKKGIFLGDSSWFGFLDILTVAVAKRSKFPGDHLNQDRSECTKLEIHSSGGDPIWDYIEWFLAYAPTDSTVALLSFNPPSLQTKSNFQGLDKGIPCSSAFHCYQRKNTWRWKPRKLKCTFLNTVCLPHCDWIRGKHVMDVGIREERSDKWGVDFQKYSQQDLLLTQNICVRIQLQGNAAMWSWPLSWHNMEIYGQEAKDNHNHPSKKKYKNHVRSFQQREYRDTYDPRVFIHDMKRQTMVHFTLLPQAHLNPTSRLLVFTKGLFVLI